MDVLLGPGFWISLLQIIGVDILLSGDNAIVIALAVRSLPRRQQRKAIVFGSVAAIVMRVALTLFVVELLRLPFLKLLGGVLLLWIGIQLLAPAGEGEKEVAGGDSLWAAIRTILFADLLMSIDNVVGIAAAAKGNVTLLMLGLAISIPLIVFGSSVTLRLMQRFPIIVTLGGALLGYIAGEMAASDVAISGWLRTHFYSVDAPASIGGALLVAIVGRWLARHRRNGGDDRAISVASRNRRGSGNAKKI